MISERWRLFLMAFLPLAVISMSAAMALREIDQERYAIQIREDERYHLDAQRDALLRDMRQAMEDVLALAWRFHVYEGAELTPREQRRLLVWDFLSFARAHGQYDQVRLLEPNGHEAIRIQRGPEGPGLAPRAPLEDQSARYDVRQAMQLQTGEVYVSRFDLNHEHGKVERPLKPVIRFMAPLFYEGGGRAGAVALNYLGQGALNQLHMTAVVSGSRLSLVDANGYWLRGADPDDEWGFMWPERHERRFSLRYPLAWETIRTLDSGQVEAEAGLYSFATVSPRALTLPAQGIVVNPSLRTQKAEESDQSWRAWKLISFRPQERMLRDLRGAWDRFVVLAFLIEVLLAVGCWIYAGTATQRKAAQRRALLLDEARRTSDALLALDGADALDDAWLDRLLRLLMQPTWLPPTTHGALFLWDESQGMLRMRAQKDMPAPLINLCGEVALGRCVCGRGAASQRRIFAPLTDERRDIRFENMSNHSALSLPLRSDEHYWGSWLIYLPGSEPLEPLALACLESAAMSAVVALERREKQTSSPRPEKQTS